MRLVKTEAGMKVLKDRWVTLTPRQRAAFILCDARHTRAHVMSAAASVGVTEEDIRQLIALGLVVEQEEPQEAAAREAADALHARGPQDRYRDAYPIATQLTAKLGLKGFRLNLAVERATTYEELRDLAPRIREAVGDEAFGPLDSALNA